MESFSGIVFPSSHLPHLTPRSQSLHEDIECVWGEGALGGIAVAYLGDLGAARRTQLIQAATTILNAAGLSTPKHHS